MKSQTEEEEWTKNICMSVSTEKVYTIMGIKGTLVKGSREQFKSNLVTATILGCLL